MIIIKFEKGAFYRLSDKLTLKKSERSASENCQP